MKLTSQSAKTQSKPSSLIKGRRVASKLIVEISQDAMSVASLQNRSRSRGKSRIVSTTSDFDRSNTEQAAAWLKEASADLGINSPSSAVVCIPRSAGCIHLLEVPQVSDADLPAVVELEMEMIYGEALDSHEWDYIALPTGAKQESRLLSVFCISTEYMDSIRAILEAARIQANCITVTEAVYAAASPSDETSLTHAVVFRDERVEALLSYQGVVLQSQTLPASTERPFDANTMYGSLRRMQASLPESLRAVPSNSLLFLRTIGADNSELHNRTALSSSLTDVLAAAGFDQAEFSFEQDVAGLLGTQKKLVDLANPTKQAPAGMTGRSKGLLAAAATLAMAVGYWGYVQYETRTIAGEVESLRKQVNSFDLQLRELEPQLAAASQLEQWDNSRVNWDKQIKAISKRFGASEDFYVVRMQMNNQGFEERNALTRIEGRAKAADNVLTLTRDLVAENPDLSIQPNGIEPNSVDRKFGSQFRLEIHEKSPSQSSTSTLEGI